MGAVPVGSRWQLYLCSAVEEGFEIGRRDRSRGVRGRLLDYGIDQILPVDSVVVELTKMDSGWSDMAVCS